MHSTAYFRWPNSRFGAICRANAECCSAFALWVSTDFDVEDWSVADFTDSLLGWCRPPPKYPNCTCIIVAKCLPLLSVNLYISKYKPCTTWDVRLVIRDAGVVPLARCGSDGEPRAFADFPVWPMAVSWDWSGVTERQPNRPSIFSTVPFFSQLV